MNQPQKRADFTRVAYPAAVLIAGLLAWASMGHFAGTQTALAQSPDRNTAMENAIEEPDLTGSKCETAIQ